MSNAPKMPAPPTIDPLLLQAYADGELTAEERAELEARLAASDGADAGRLSALSEMGELVRFANEQAIEDINLDALWPRLEAALDAPAAATSSRAPASAAARPTSSRASWWQRLRESLAQHRVWLTPAFVATATAALILIPQAMNQTPQTLPAASDSEPQTIVIVAPPQDPNADWLVSYPSSSRTPVIWYVANPSADQDAAPLDPTTEPAPQPLPPQLWPAIEQTLRQLRATPQGQSAPGRVMPTLPVRDPDAPDHRSDPI